MTNGTTPVLSTGYTYRGPSTGTTSGQVSNLVLDASGYDVTYAYEYDGNDNITQVTSGGKTTKYTYDSANQLLRENNQAAGKTWVWEYDDAGNIESRTEYPYTSADNPTGGTTVNYSYDDTWGDLLTGYGNYSIDSDAIGNPTNVKQGNTVIRSYTWEHGRNLATLTENGNTWSYTYNAEGLRTQRTNGSTTYNYIYNGSSLSQMTVGSNTLYFAYDASGRPVSVTMNGDVFYYVTNLQGDVMAILDADGRKVGSFSYTAYGEVSISMGHTVTLLNPLLYRGYVHDLETGLYYLQSCYYDSSMGRFLNDDVSIIPSHGILACTLYVCYFGKILPH